MGKILIIDDDPRMRQNILEILEYEGLEGVEAENGRAGVHLAKQLLPDLILCDVMMPELSGYGVLIELRHTPETATIPFIFLTAKSDMDDLRKGMDLGADDYLVKPCNIDELLTAIRTRLEKHQAFSQQFHQLQMNLSRYLPHELRTPLQGILGLAEFLIEFGPNLQQETTETELVEIGTYLRKDALRLKHLIENYLLYTELELLEHDDDRRQRSRWTRLSWLDPHTVVTFAVNRAAQKAKRQNDVNFTLTAKKFWAAEETVCKIVQELTDNALKFSEPGTPVTVCVFGDRQRFSLSITDQGRGMSQEQIETIGAYTQFERERYEQQGIGLGLELVRHLMRINHGAFQVESAPEQGTTVTVTFPNQQEKPPPS